MVEPSRVEELFFAALEKSTPEERAAYLDDACQDEPELRQRVEKLLAAHPHAKGFLEPPVGELGPTVDSPKAPSPTETIGSRIGPYKLLQQLGEGGFGVVFMAEQTQPVRRMVALKIIKPGMDTQGKSGDRGVDLMGQMLAELVLAMEIFWSYYLHLAIYCSCRFVEKPRSM